MLDNYFLDFEITLSLIFKMNMFFFQQFKKRYFVLKQESDFTFSLQFYKDEKKTDAKGAIFMDLAVEAKPVRTCIIIDIFSSVSLSKQMLRKMKGIYLKLTQYTYSFQWPSS